MTAETIFLSMPESDIAVLTFDTPNKSANVLSNSVLDNSRNIWTRSKNVQTSLV